MLTKIERKISEVNSKGHWIYDNCPKYSGDRLANSPSAKITGKIPSLSLNILDTILEYAYKVSLISKTILEKSHLSKS